MYRNVIINIYIMLLRYYCYLDYKYMLYQGKSMFLFECSRYYRTQQNDTNQYYNILLCIGTSYILNIT